MAGTSIHSLVFKISTSADLKGMVATRSELSTAKKLMQETQTATEKYGTSVTALNALHRKGAIDAETHRRAVDRLNKEMKETQAAAKGAGALGGGLGGLAGALGVGVGIGTGVSFLKDSIAAAEEAAQSEARLGAVLEATGNSTGFTKDQILAYSDTLQRLTGISDELFTDAQAELATFGNIHGKVFTDAIRLAADLSKVFKTDLKSETENLGRALSNPLEAVDRLKFGTEKLTEAEKELIKSMAEAGDIAGAQAKILEIGLSKVGGAAEAMRSPLAGLNEDIGNLKETLGGLFSAGTAGGKGLDALGASIRGINDTIKGEGNPEQDGFWMKFLFGNRGGALGRNVVDQMNGGRPQAPLAQTERPPDLPVVTDEDVKEGQRLVNEAEAAKRKRQEVDDNLREQEAKKEEQADREAQREAQRASDEAERFTKSLLDKTKSPQEKLREGMGTIQEALKLGLIGKSEAASAEAQLARDLVGPDAEAAAEERRRQPSRTAGAALLRGSSEAFSAIMRGADRVNDEPAKKTEKNTEKTYRAAEQLLEETRKANSQPKAPIQILEF